MVFQRNNFIIFIAAVVIGGLVLAFLKKKMRLGV